MALSGLNPFFHHLDDAQNVESFILVFGGEFRDRCRLAAFHVPLFAPFAFRENLFCVRFPRFRVCEVFVKLLLQIGERISRRPRSFVRISPVQKGFPSVVNLLDELRRFPFFPRCFIVDFASNLLQSLASADESANPLRRIR